MTIEVTSTLIRSGVVRIYGIDCSEENLQRMVWIRDDGTERKMIKNPLNICPLVTPSEESETFYHRIDYTTKIMYNSDK